MLLARLVLDELAIETAGMMVLMLLLLLHGRPPHVDLRELLLLLLQVMPGGCVRVVEGRMEALLLLYDGGGRRAVDDDAGR